MYERNRALKSYSNFAFSKVYTFNNRGRLKHEIIEKKHELQVFT